MAVSLVERWAVQLDYDSFDKLVDTMEVQLVSMLVA